MGEIKSTLDLVMERTKNLTFTAGEKKQQQEEEIRKRLNGIMVKYLDGLLDDSELGEEWTQLKKNYQLSPDSGNQIFLLVALSFLDLSNLSNLSNLSTGNAPILKALNKIAAMDVAPFESILGEYKNHLQSALNDRTEGIKSEWQRNIGISGSAVNPNMEADAVWQALAEKTVLKYNRFLDIEKDKWLKCN